MSVDEGVLIAIKLIGALLIAAATIAVTRNIGNSSASKIHEIYSIGTASLDSHLKSVSNGIVSGADARSIIDEYRLQVPILLVTGELYSSSGDGYSYDEDEIYSCDVDKIFDRRSPEYINPNLEYVLDSGFNQKGEPAWITIVQTDVANDPDLIEVLRAKAQSESMSSTINLKKTLIQEQYKKYISAR